MELNNQLNSKLNTIFKNNNTSYSYNYPKMTYLKNFYYLLKTSLFVIRQEWVWYILMACITPLSLMFFLGFYFKYDNPDMLLFIITGNMVMSLVTSAMLTLGQDFGRLKQVKGFDYYATLPISKISIIVAFVTRTTLLSLPSVAIIFVIGSVYLNIPFNLHPIILVVIILGGYSLSGIGAIIGIYSKDAQTASLITQIVHPLIVFLAPVLIPEKSLPKIIMYVSYVIPTKYVANAFRYAVQGKISYIDIIILLTISVASVYLVGIKLDWRVEN